MTDSQRILELAKEHNGMITTGIIVDAGIFRGTLKYLTDSSSLERASKGVYILPELWKDEFVNIQNRFKHGIYFLETELFKGSYPLY